MDNAISGAGTSAVFTTPGIRQTEPGQGQQTRQPQADPVAERAQQFAPAQAQQQTLNTAPTEQQRDSALAAGQSRGSFVDIRA